MHAHSVRGAMLAVALIAITASPASAHSGNPNYRSVLHATPLQPALPGVTVSVVGYDSYLHLRSTAKKPVVIYGYEHDQFARILPDGTVQENHNSPAYWLNQDRFATTPVPATASARATPDWQTVDKTGQFTWHDHRMHWMAKTRPSKVKDPHTKTKVFDYTVPIAEGPSKATIHGTLYWVGQPGGPSGLAIGAMVVLVLLAGGGSLLVIRRRRAAGGTADGGVQTKAGEEPKEAW